MSSHRLTASRRTLAAWAAGTVLALGLGVAAPALADPPSESGRAAPAAQPGRTEPGPALLDAPEPRAPQFENTGIWKADPIKVCHASAYRASEYVHQGCLYDDQGGGNNYNYPARTLLRNYTYPTDPIYRRNVADIVEVRTRVLPDATAFRVTYNSMTDPELVGTTLALGDSPAPQQVPHGANTVMPAEKFVTVHGDTGDIVDAASGDPLPIRPTVAVDKERRQVEIRVPRAAFDPAGGEVRLGAASGLWDRGEDQYLVPQTTADETHPGGAVLGDSSPSAFFDSAFRFDEPMNGPWRDEEQKQAIANGDLSQFFATVDFGKVADGVDDDMADEPKGTPTTGYMNRIFASAFETVQGRRLPGDPGVKPPPGGFTQQGGLATGTQPGSPARPSAQLGYVCRDNCTPDLAGQLQRYSIYVPEQEAPADGYASLTFLPGYALTANDQVVGSSDIAHQVGNRPENPTLVVNTDGRGSDHWFYGQSGASVFETIADVERNYDTNEDKRVLAGFSSGAYGANKLSLQFPDVFSRAFICDGLNKAPSGPGVNGVADTLPVDTATKHEPGSDLTGLLPSRRNQPVIEWAGLNDDFIPYNITRERANAYAASQQEYEFITWTGLAAEHLVMCHNGMWEVLTKRLGDMEPKTPFHVTYVRNPAMDDPRSGLLADHAYWLSGIESRDGERGTIDAVSRGYGLADPPPVGKQTTAGVSEGTTSPVNPYTREFRDVPEPAEVPAANVLDIKGTNISAVTVDPEKAKVDCNAQLNVTTDGPMSVRLLGCGPARLFGPTNPDN